MRQQCFTKTPFTHKPPKMELYFKRLRKEPRAAGKFRHTQTNQSIKIIRFDLGDSTPQNRTPLLELQKSTASPHSVEAAQGDFYPRPGECRNYCRTGSVAVSASARQTEAKHRMPGQTGSSPKVNIDTKRRNPRNGFRRFCVRNSILFESSSRTFS